MKYVNTLEIYKGALAAGHTEAQAINQANTLENSFKAVYEDFKDTFTSNKLVSILGGVIIIALTGIGGELWYLSKEVSILSRDMQDVRHHMFEKSNLASSSQNHTVPAVIGVKHDK